MQIEETAIADVKILCPKKFGDDRGFFSEVWNAQTLKEAGLDLTFVQDNHAHNAEAGVVRGLHYQLAPKAQGKLVRALRGAIIDVAVDIRVGSPTFGQHVAVELSAENWRQLWVPAGFAHGYCTLQPDTEIVYKVTDYYSPEHDCGIFWNDPDLNINWSVSAEKAILSEKDKILPLLKDQTRLFEFKETR
ncbi:dTDP-4-dehydrorhamnose 3,5-epimerase [Sneathiella sp. HT1-7]|jgi:dTDP-4-dehydrorhamnose 3,5-epimerase|uniref:dTDP-4-dehydrorhamnose 3,5-epimerase n=1 Tax=Sneathiella sp. HT1-7 TaxID=2887192 RepID=UPI001D137AED|nr:dTDP-4-dehydrorhamnose 3,5-epimerase [Sneathiella sp. HT1-7]MCC3305394.1 dTDP-4-dehydrorhamnose 3,5-epimerase [Sneathiella sp. HT1-7]